MTDLRRKSHLPGGRQIPVVILANKGDITVATLPSQIDDYCKANDILAWFITSAKNNLNIGNIYISKCSQIEQVIIIIGLFLYSNL